jgi:hypothetical protein
VWVDWQEIVWWVFPLLGVHTMTHLISRPGQKPWFAAWKIQRLTSAFDDFDYDGHGAWEDRNTI